MEPVDVYQICQHCASLMRHINKVTATQTSQEHSHSLQEDANHAKSAFSKPTYYTYLMKCICFQSTTLNTFKQE